MSKIYPVILSGGNGTRLWPLSRASSPKQFLKINQDSTLLQKTVSRINSFRFMCSPWIVANQSHRFLIEEQLTEISASIGGLILEPVARNTAPAICLAALALIEIDEDSIIFICPADHSIENQESLSNAITSARVVAEQGYFVTFGVYPYAPLTGYGYIKMGKSLLDSSQVPIFNVDKFVEKPDFSLANQYVTSGKYLWNSGMFLCKASTYLDAIKTLEPEIFNSVQASWDQRNYENDFIKPNPTFFAMSPKKSIDYAIMERSENVAVAIANFDWNDIGSWDAIWKILSKDEKGNHQKGDVFLSNVSNSYIRAEGRMVAVLGLDNIIVVETKDAVLVMDQSKAQLVKEVVDFLSEQQRNEHIDHTRVYRSWGWYEGIDSGDRFQVKHIMVNPGASLSLQMHYHRAEHWVVISGTAQVTIEDQESLLSENQSTYIPIGKKHRLTNPGRLPLHMIEVQSGSYLGEDDIVRFFQN